MKQSTTERRRLVVPTHDEDAAITAAAISDRDARPLTDEEWARVKPTVRRGRPPLAEKRPTLNMRVDAEVLQAFRASGPGWQTRINQALKDWLRTHPLA